MDIDLPVHDSFVPKVLTGSHIDIYTKSADSTEVISWGVGGMAVCR